MKLYRVQIKNCQDKLIEVNLIIGVTEYPIWNIYIASYLSVSVKLQLINKADNMKLNCFHWLNKSGSYTLWSWQHYNNLQCMFQKGLERKEKSKTQKDRITAVEY